MSASAVPCVVRRTRETRDESPGSGGSLDVELRTYLHAFRKHWMQIAFCTLLGVIGGAVAYLLTPTVYSSSVTFYASTPVTEESNPLSAGQFAQARVNSYVSLLESQSLAERIVREQHLNLSPADLTEKIEAKAQLNTVLVTAEVRDSSPDRSLLIARGIASTFGNMVDQLDNEGRKTKIVVINVVSGPALTPYPVWPSIHIYGGLGIVMGAVLGALIAVIREILDMTVRTNETATKLVEAPVIGTIDYDPAAKKSPLLLREAANSLRGESFRQLRTNIQFMDAAESASALMVTSSVADEGKSTAAINLALSFVEFGESVLLVDADLRRPRLAGYLGIEGEIGLTNVLVGQIEFADAIQEWGSDGLHVLPSGSVPPNPSELLGGKRMAQLMRDFRLKYQKIIIDTPPLVPVTDAAVCSALVDGVVFVIRWGRTHRSQITTAVDALRSAKARVLGGVLNMRKVSRGEKRKYAAPAYYGAASPPQVVNNAVFQHKDGQGSPILVMSDNTVDISDRAGQARGEEWGTDTGDGKEPPADKVLDIEAGLPSEDDRIVGVEEDDLTVGVEEDDLTVGVEEDDLTVDAEEDELTVDAEEDDPIVGALDEDLVLDELNDVGGEDSAEVSSLIEAESKRGETDRGENVVAVAQVTEPAPSPSVLASAREVEDTSADSETDTEGGVELASINTIEAVLERVGDDPEPAMPYGQAEDNGRDNEGKTPIAELTEIENPWPLITDLGAVPRERTKEANGNERSQSFTRGTRAGGDQSNQGRGRFRKARARRR